MKIIDREDFKMRLFFGVSKTVWAFFFLSILGAIGATYLNNECYKKNYNKHILLESNSFGCKRYSFNGDKYWTCPDKSITSIEVSNGRYGNKIEPVINE